MRYKKKKKRENVQLFPPSAWQFPFPLFFFVFVKFHHIFMFGFFFFASFSTSILAFQV